MGGRNEIFNFTEDNHFSTVGGKMTLVYTFIRLCLVHWTKLGGMVNEGMLYDRFLSSMFDRSNYLVQNFVSLGRF